MHGDINSNAKIAHRIKGSHELNSDKTLPERRFSSKQLNTVLTKLKYSQHRKMLQGHNELRPRVKLFSKSSHDNLSTLIFYNEEDKQKNQHQKISDIDRGASYPFLPFGWVLQIYMEGGGSFLTRIYL